MQSQWHWFYFLIGIILLVTEVFTLTFYILPIGLAVILTGVFGFFSDSIFLHGLFFIIVNFILMYAVSRWRKSKFLKPQDSHFHVGIVGQTGIVVEEFQSYLKPGKVKVFSDVWDLYCEPHHEQEIQKLKIGDSVKVTGVEGNKVIVKID